jgi:hypothetical protein
MYETPENRVFGGRWEQISPADRRYLIAAAQLAREDDTVSTGDIAAALGRNPESVSGNRGRLINQHHVLQPAGHGRLRFSIPGLAAWVRRQAQPATDHPGPATARSIVDEWAQHTTHPPIPTSQDALCLSPEHTGPDLTRPDRADRPPAPRARASRDGRVAGRLPREATVTAGSVSAPPESGSWP